MNHTGGSWVVKRARPGLFICQDAEQTLGDAAIAKVFSGSRRRMSEVEANATLIAAAPDLLSACKDVALLINSGALPEFIGEPWIARLRAAIEKAEAQ